MLTSVSPIPVFPKVPSTHMPLGSIKLFFSASKIIPRAVLSLIDPPGLTDSNFAYILSYNWTKGVLPTK